MCGEEGDPDDFSMFTALLVILAGVVIASVFLTEVILPAAFKFFM